MTDPRRFFRSTLLTAGTLLTGAALALPAAANADAPSYPAQFGPGVAAPSHGDGDRSVRVFHGTPSGDAGLVRVDIDGDDQLRFSEFRADGERTVAEYGQNSAGTVQSLLFAGAGHLDADHPDRTAVAAAVQVGASTWQLVVHGADGSPGAVKLTLGGRPTGLTVGRFLPGVPSDFVAVALASGETRVYGIDTSTGGLTQFAAWGDLAGPLTSWRSGNSSQMALGATRGGVAVSARGLNGNAVSVTPDATIPSLADMQATGSEDLDPSGRRWATRPSSTSPSDTFGYSPFGGRANAFDGSILELDRAVVAHFGRPGDADTVGAVGPSGSLFRAPDGDETYVPYGGTDATLVDVDGDTRDDLVVVRSDSTTGRSTLVVHRNTTGDDETRATLDAEQFATPLSRDSYGTWSTTKTKVTWKAPDDGASYRCAVDGGSDPSFVPCDDGFEMSGLALGKHVLQVQRREQGLTFWAPIATFQFHVRPAAPAFVGTPPESTNAPAATFEPRPGSILQCRAGDPPPPPRGGAARNTPGFVDCDNPYGAELTEGPHDIDFRWVDLASDVASDVTRWSVDVDRTAPDALQVASRPDARTTDTSALIEYTAPSDVITVECSVDGSPYAACVGPVRLSGLQPGHHVVKVRGTDRAGNTTEPTVVEWDVVAVSTPAVPSAPSTPQPDPAAAPAAAPAPAPATPVAAPKPAEPKPVLAAPAAPVKAPSATVTGRALNVGCAVPGATSYRCEVTVTKGGKRLGRAVRSGNGAVQIALTREGARKVQRLGGLTVRVKVRATADGRTTTTTKTVRILPTKALVVPTDGLFAFDSAKPSAAGTRLAKAIAAQLYGARELTIVGHTDSKGSDEVNEALGLKRARAFAALLRHEGLDGTKVVVQSAGERSPRASNDTERGQQLNRRVEVTVRY